MKLAIGMSVHTGWAATVVAGGGWASPVIAAREHVELLGDDMRFVFHKAAEMGHAEATQWVARARNDALERASSVLRRLAAAHAAKGCAIVAKKSPMLPLEQIVAAHPRIHTAEGGFYRDVLVQAAERAGMRVAVIAPAELDAKDERLVRVGKIVGKPWSADWKIAVMAAWSMAAR